MLQTTNYQTPCPSFYETKGSQSTGIREITYSLFYQKIHESSKILQLENLENIFSIVRTCATFFSLKKAKFFGQNKWGCQKTSSWRNEELNSKLLTSGYSGIDSIPDQVLPVQSGAVFLSTNISLGTYWSYVILSWNLSLKPFVQIYSCSNSNHCLANIQVLSRESTKYVVHAGWYGNFETSVLLLSIIRCIPLIDGLRQW